MRFSVKLALFFLSLSLLMLGVVTAISFKGKELLEEQMLSNIEREAKLLNHLVEHNLFERYQDVRTFSLSLGQVDKGQLRYISSGSNFVSSINEFVRNYKVYRRIMVFDLDGDLLAYNTKNQYGKALFNAQLSAQKIASSPWFEQAVAGVTLSPELQESSYVIGPERFLIDDDPNSFDMIFTSLIYDSDGQKVGLWVNVVDFSAIEEIVINTYDLLSKQGLVSSKLTLIDHRGSVILDYHPIEQINSGDFRDFTVLRRLNLVTSGVEAARNAVVGLSGTEVSSHYPNNIEFVTGYAHSEGVFDFKGLGWSVLIRVSGEEVFSQSNALFTNTILLSLLSLFFIMILSLSLSTRIAGPLVEVTRVLKKLARGDNDIVLPQVNGKDEIATMVLELAKLKDMVIERKQLSARTDVTEIKRREKETTMKLEQEVARQTEEARESEKRLRTVFDTALDGIIVFDMQGRILDVNRSTEMIFGRAREELIGESLSMLLPAHQFHSHSDKISEFISVGKKQRVGKPTKMEGLHMSGRVFPMELSVGETKAGDAHIFVGVIKDITVQEQTIKRESRLQKELTEREWIYRVAFKEAAIGICRIALDGRFIEVNDKLCEIFGDSREELLKMTLSDVTYPIDRPKTQELVTSLIQGKSRTFSIDKRYLNKLGDAFWANVSLSVVNNEEGAIQYLMGVIEDISHRKNIEKELRSAKAARDELLRGMELASDAGGVCNWVLNVDTGSLKWDDSMYRLYGIDKEETLRSEHWENALHPEDKQLEKVFFQNSIDNKTVYNSEYRIINQKTKQVRWIKAAGDVVYDNESGDELVFGINLDITEEKDAQAALERETQSAKQANEAKSRFLATMSHEIRTPMNGVIGMADLLKETELNSDQSTMVSTIRDSSLSLLEIINDVLDFSKIESGQMELDLTDTDVLTLIEKTMEALWVNASQKNVGLYLELDSDLPQSLLIDSVRTRQVLLNLLGNAIKFTSNQDNCGFVKVKVSYSSNQLSITVEDNGVGMTEQQVEKLFKPFTQADSSTTRKYGGTGLGLSISKSFIDLMGGVIEAKSEHLKGSQFSFTIPAETATSQTHFNDYDLSQYVIVLRIKDPILLDMTKKALLRLHPENVIEGELERMSDSRAKIIVVGDSLDMFGIEDTFLYLHFEDDPAAPKGPIASNHFAVGTYPLKPSELALGLAELTGYVTVDLDPLDHTAEPMTPLLQEQYEEFKNAVILCAEDQPTNQLVLGKQLTKLGYQYEMTENGQQALDRWMDGDYAIVLTDCHMPEMDGFELTSEIRRLEHKLGLERTIVVAITANALAGEAEHCLGAGMDDYIAKPVEISMLGKVLSSQLRGKVVSNKPESNLHQEGDNPSAPNNLVDNVLLIDREQLTKVIGSEDEAMHHAILSMFWETVSQDVIKLEQAIVENELDAVRSIAHGAKGASMSSGATTLGELFLRIEKGYGKNEENSELLAKVKETMTEIESQLKDENII